MKKELLEIEYWKIKGIAAELSAIAHETRFTESEIEKLRARKNKLTKDFEEKQIEKDKIITEVLERVGVKEGNKFEIVLHDETKNGIIEYEDK